MENINNYKIIETEPGYSIDNVVDKLLEARKNGEYVCYIFNGHKLYSDTVSLDSAYLEVTGKTKEEFDKMEKDYDNQHKISILDENMIEIQPDVNLEATIYDLLAAKARKEHAYCNFNGHILYSDNVTMDSAYLEVIGKTKEEFDKMEKEYDKKIMKEDLEAKNNISTFIEKGNNLIYPQLQEEWVKCVNMYCNDGMSGKILEQAIEIMEVLSTGATLEQVEQIIINKGSIDIMGEIERILFNFSPRGPEFCEYTHRNNMNDNLQKIINDKKQEFAELGINIESKQR